MLTKKSIYFSLLFSLIIFLGVAVVNANTPIDNTITYQGQLEDNGVPFSGSADFDFKLFDTSTGGTQLGSTVSLTSVNVTNGLFTVELDFGYPYDGTQAWIELTVNGTVLAPRQKMTAAPEAVHALSASSVAWSNVTGVPADIADGDADSLAALTCADGEVAVYSTSTSSWACGAAGSGSSYVSTILVSPTVGNATASGTTLLNAVSGCSSASATNPMLIKLEPGIYDLGSTHLTMVSYCDIEGSGQNNTQIIGADSTAVIDMASNVSLRLLTVENNATGSSSSYKTINSSGTLTAVVLSNVTVVGAPSTNWNQAIYNDGEMTLNQASVLLEGGANSTNTGIYNWEKVTINDSSFVLLGGRQNLAIQNNDTLSMTDTHIQVSNGTRFNQGVYVTGVQPSLATIRNSHIIVSGTSTDPNRAIFAGSGSSSALANIYNSILSSDEEVAITISSGAINIASSSLDGTTTSTVKCAGVTDENFDFFANTCP